MTTRPSTRLLIPPDVFKRWMETPAFRNEVLGLFAEPMADLASLIDAMAFQRLAAELGTVREIASRLLLRRFGQKGWSACHASASILATVPRRAPWSPSARVHLNHATARTGAV
ncbi:hypothetical protein [Polaromonas sp. CG_9.11]|uniref:hypothetical protein n=1 Tax=Polaromonas sp. CG_9.11 TaxID=2787730 RepID=UPI001A360B3D|nr:hypothetical protein [Polaromonas sp. CG_9.11]MBG6076461.1 hypothetical protein [Polaromonas sp. CG_9.11]